MIPKPYIARWKDSVPWQTSEQVEQGLVISRTLIQIFLDEFLKENLAFRGGTALHKLYLNPAPRYSEDIDLVQIKGEPIKPLLVKIGEVINFFDEKRVVKSKQNNNTILYRFISEYSAIRMRLKIEINCREHFNVLGWLEYPYEVQNQWFSGKTAITTYHLSELLGTKLRALYQRKKGRDLFDLYYANSKVDLDFEEMIYCFKEYMKSSGNKLPTKKQFLLNIEEKQNDPGFIGDINALLRQGIEYDIDEAFVWLKNVIIEDANKNCCSKSVTNETAATIPIFIAMGEKQ